MDCEGQSRSCSLSHPVEPDSQSFPAIASQLQEATLRHLAWINICEYLHPKRQPLSLQPDNRSFPSKSQIACDRRLAHLEAVDLDAALVVDVRVLALRRSKELLVVQEVHVPRRLLHLCPMTRSVKDCRLSAMRPVCCRCAFVACCGPLVLARAVSTRSQTARGLCSGASLRCSDDWTHRQIPVD